MIPFGVTHGLMMPNSLAHQVMLLAMNLSLGVVAAVYSSTLVTIIAGMVVARFAVKVMQPSLCEVADSTDRLR